MNYSPGVLVDGTLYVSGQIGQNLKTKAVPADFDTELKLCLDNIGIVLKAAGMTYKDVVAVQVYLTDIDLFALGWVAVQRVVIDTNVLVSALRSRRGAAFRLISLLGDPRWQPIGACHEQDHFTS